MVPPIIPGPLREIFQLYVLENRAQIITGLIGVLVIFIVPKLPSAYSDYRAWLLLEPGGVPHNLLGWLLQSLLGPLASEPFDTTCYADAKVQRQAGPQASTAFLKPDDVPKRVGARPSVGHWAVPHRQLSDAASAETKKECQTFIASLAESQPSRMAIKKSGLDSRGPALFKTQGLQLDALAKQVDGEIVHMHNGDGSVHVMLAPLDAKLVIERGWGQRFSLSGKVLYSGLLMVYAPRESRPEELKVVQAIIQAGVTFMLGDDGENVD